ncbi:hypothetical protein ACFLQ2_02945 [archaeon]
MKPLLFFLLLIAPAFADVLPTPGEGAVLPLLLVTIAIELGVFYFLYKKTAKQRQYLTVLGANIVSYGVITGLFFEEIAYGGGLLSVWILEIPIILFEGGVLHYFNKKMFPLKEAMMASLKMNLTTIVIGFLLALLMMLDYSPALEPMV